MTAAAILVATLRFAAWELAMFATALRIARAFRWRSAVEEWLAVVSFEIVLESTIAAAFSFTHTNAVWAYWLAAAICACSAIGLDLRWAKPGPRSWTAAAMAALAAPLIALSFRPVDEIDSINYLHYLIEWMGNRATPYTFATNYVAFWELSFLPTWMVTRVDLFFPLIALKAVIVLALALWLIGRELQIEPRVLAWSIFGALLMRHYWLEHSGVTTLKNDALHGAGFALLALVLLRYNPVFLTLGIVFSTVKYTGIFTSAIAVVLLLLIHRGLPKFAAWTPLLLLTTAHYYLRALFLHGNPFYPFQINLGPIHLPGEADLSYSSILYNLRDPRLWRAFFLPANALSPAGILFPETLVATLAITVWMTIRRRAPLAIFLLVGWLLYFRSVYSASGGPGDLAFILNSLNSLRYVDGVLAVSELLLISLLGRYALPIVAVQLASRLYILYDRVPWDAVAWTVPAIAIIFLLLNPRRAAAVFAALLVVFAPIVVHHNRPRWTPFWNEIRPQLDPLRGPDLAYFAMDEGSYFAGHVVAAGNPVDPRVRSLLPEDLSASRPKYLAVLVTPGNDWRPHYAKFLADLGYQVRTDTPTAAIYEFIAEPRRARRQPRESQNDLLRVISASSVPPR